MHTSVVIVNYRTASLTYDCLESLAKHVVGRSDVHVTLVDNLSGDDSVSQLQSAIDDRGWKSWVTLMPLDRNGGFAFGNNAAIREVLAADAERKPDYVWLLNPDTLVREGSLEKLIAYLEANPQCGLVGSRLEDPDGTPQRSAFRFPSLASEFDDGLRLGLVSKVLSSKTVAPPISNTAVKTGWVAGASMLVRREVFEDVGLLDDEYFMYYEETDFCRQASLVGWYCAYEPASRVVHLVGQASGVTIRNAVPKRRPQYWFDSRRRYFVKNHGAVYSGLVDVAWAVSYASWCVRSKLQGKPSYDPPKLLVDFVRNSVWMRGVTT
ncbi:glycosyltransferase family 2 protein [Rubripirellula reticaptiva]|nr:glycosyltransferase family 2 protein [Rubripirellula reticaptiva]